MLYVKTAVSWKFLVQGISSHHENPVFQGFRHILPLWSYLLSNYFTTCLIGWLKNWPVVPKTLFFCEKNMWFFSIIHETFCLCGENLSEKLLWCLTKYFCGLLQLSDSPASPAKKLFSCECQHPKRNFQGRSTIHSVCKYIKMAYLEDSAQIRHGVAN